MQLNYNTQAVILNFISDSSTNVLPVSLHGQKAGPAIRQKMESPRVERKKKQQQVDEFQICSDST